MSASRAEVLEAERKGKRNDELLSTAGSILGSIFGGKRSRTSVLGKLGSAAGKRGRSDAAKERVEAQENKIQHIHHQLEQLEAELTDDVTSIDAKWMGVAKEITPMTVPLERTDVKVTQLALVWIPVP